MKQLPNAHLVEHHMQGLGFRVAHLVEHHMQPARAPRAKEHTNNPVQRPNFRGHATGDVEVTRDYGKGPSLPTGSKEPEDRRT